ncbi:DEAD/DEAH box helicase [uncultured Phascolarctobacterium sp.]|uniref:DEAD/DEAH box helicase n=1 Tax=uncultured Phascolarctobacterium sp. TaxID=512296 RepID=UPI0025F74D0B|nr:DEAD/DEAH box helicase [uncultured Phascolarctobacterium sp.]
MITLRPYQQDLIEDIRSAIAHGMLSVCAVLGCGGGKSIIQGSIAAMATAKNNNVLFLVHRKELCQQITGTFTACDVDFKYCDVMMVQTASRRINKLTEPALIIVDEAHHILSNSYTRILERFPTAVVLGFTATPQRMNEGGLGAVFQQLIESVSTEWLIQNHYLAPYKYYGVQLADASKLHTKQGDYDRQEVEDLMNRSAIFGSAVENWQKYASGKKTIIYCSSITTSKNTVKAFQSVGIPSAHLDGTTPKQERDRVVNDFRAGKILALSNVDLFGEGFDVPDCEAVVLLRPTKSLTLHIQQSMRSMRADPNNPDKVAIILDHVGNYTRHGLPDDKREWSLAAKKKRKENKINVKQCPNCFAVLPTSARICKFCKFDFTERDEEVKESWNFVDGVILGEISKQPYENYVNCKTWEEIDNFRKAKKYNFFWGIRKAIELDIPIPAKYKWQVYKLHLNNMGKQVKYI